MKKRTFLLSIICATALSVAAQNKQTLFGEAILTQANNLREQKDFKGAIDLYNLVHDGDPYYWDILTERATVHCLDSNYTQSIKEADYLAQQTGQIKRTGLLIKGAAYSTSGDYKNAYATFDKILEANPHDFNAVYEKGIVAFSEKNYDLAMQYFQNTLLLNPYYFRAHYNLGIVYSKLGRLTEAIYALQAAIMFTSEGEYASAAFGALEEVAVMSEGVTKAYNERKVSNNPFEQVDEIIAAKIVKSSEYKSGLIIDELATRQMQVAITNANLDLSDSNFAMQFYLPIFKELAEKDMNAFQVFLFSDFNLESIKKYANKKSNRNAFKNMKMRIDQYCDDIIGARMLNYEARTKAPKKYIYIPTDQILIVGEATFNYAKNDIDFGDDYFTFYQNGILISEGNYKQNKKQGTWKYYGKSSGNLTKIEEYNDGVLANFKQYYSNGVLAGHETYDNKEQITSLKKYNFAGILSTEEVYENKTNYKSKYYGQFGNLTRSITIKNDKIVNGPDTIFYNSGNPLRVMNFLNGEIDGWLHEYYESGKLKEKRFYKKGLVNDVETSYWENGNMLSEISYLDDKQHGVVKYYNKDGKLIKSDNYQNGKANGLEIAYDEQTGKKQYEKLFKQNDLYAYTYYNDQEAVVFEIKDNGKPVTIYKQFDKFGNNISYFEADEKGVPKNLAYVFYPSGAVKSIDSIAEGEINGTSIKNYESGILSEQTTYIKGLKSGMYHKYYDNGRIYYSGNYTNDTLNGIWEYYNHDGTIFRKIFFNNDKLNGSEYYYYPNGKLMERNIYFQGYLAGIVKHDTAGNVVDSVYHKNLNGPVSLKYKNGNPYLKGTLKSGRFDGLKQAYYSNGNLQVQSNYSFGEQNGTETFYYPNGKKKYIATYVNGQRSGLTYSLNSNGDTLDVYPYTDGEIDGTTATYLNKEKRYEIQYDNGKLNGTYTYYANGKVAIILYYYQDLLIGYTYYNKDNQLLPMIPIKKGTAEIVGYYPNGTKSFEANRKNNKYEGAVTLYFENGKVAEKRNFVNGNYNGTSTYFNINGTLVKQVSYQEDEFHGAKMLYDQNGKLIQNENFNMGDLDGETIYGDKKYIFYSNQLMKY